MTPMAYPMWRDATPVVCMNADPAGLIALGTAPATPARALETPDPAIAPWTPRKSTVRSPWYEAFCAAMAAPLV